jgi:signal transduction histidine kinase/ligand-binding sensor domain-containing protein/DNA-binding response OmpR family regulator
MPCLTACLHRLGRLRHLLTALVLGGMLAGQSYAYNSAPADEEYLIDGWETDQGLPQNSATAIVQTPDGYLWFGTFNGLVRFDGVQFTVFDCANAPALPSTEIINLHLDHGNRLWISTSMGTAYVKDGKWRVFLHGQGWVGDFVRYFAETADGQLYLTTFSGKVLHFRGDSFEELPPPPGRPMVSLVPCVDDQGILWAITEEFVVRFTGGKWQTLAPVDVRANEKPISAGPSRDGGFWLLTQEHIRKYRHGRLEFDGPGPGKPLIVWSLYEDSAGAVWVCSNDDGLHRFTVDGNWRHFSKQSGLACDAVRCIFEDREHNIWVGTDGGGLQRFRMRIFRNWGTEQGLPQRILKSVTLDAAGSIVVGTHGQGIARLSDGKVSLPWPAFPAGPVPPFVNAVLCDSKNRLWVGGHGDGLVLLEGTRSRKFDATDMKLDPGDLHVYSLFEDSAKRIWIGTDRGLTRFDAGGFKTYSLPVVTNLHSIRCIAEDRRTGTLWAGHHAGGLYTLTDDDLRIVEDGEELRRNERISSLHTAADGTLWIGTEDSGLIYRSMGRFKRITEAQGLPSRRIGAILEDGKGNLWVGSNRGVLRFRRDDVEAVAAGRKARIDCQQFGPSDGLATQECAIGTQPTAVRDNSGKLWFATSKGLAMMDPDRVWLNPLPPPVAVQEVWIDGRLAAGLEPLHTTAEPVALRVSIPPGTRRVEIHYAGLSLSAPPKMSFRYMLEGIDEDWIDVGNRRIAYLQDLKPGKYRFRVCAANNDGIWNEQGVATAIEVLPFAWQTLWFKVLVLWVVVGAAALLAWQFTRARLRRQLERLEQQGERRARQVADAANRAKSEFLANMSHEIRTPMNGILGMTEQVLETPLSAEQHDCLGLVKASADHLLDVINDILDFSKIEAGKLDLDAVAFDLRGMLAETLRSLELRARSKGLALTCDIGSDVPVVVEGDAGRLRQVLVNLVGNAIKFTDRGAITVTVHSVNADGTNGNIGDQGVPKPGADTPGTIELDFAVTDTGIGIAREKHGLIFDPFTQADGSTTRSYGGTGLGLTISSRLVALMGGQLRVTSELARGSCFYFRARFQVSTDADHAKSAESPPEFSNLAALIVNEDDTVRQQLREMLVQWHATAATAATASEALSELRRAATAGEPYGLLLVAASLQATTASTFLEAIRREPELASLKAVILAESDHSHPDNGREPAGTAWLHKPVTEAGLQQAISAALSSTLGEELVLSPSRNHIESCQPVAEDRPFRLRILLVEDNSVNQRLALRVLEKQWHDVILVGNGRDALTALEGSQFDLVLMDVQMPVMDGLETTRAIREREEKTGEHLPIVAMTAHAMKGDRERCLSAGMDDYVSKPIQTAELLRTLRRAASKKAAADSRDHGQAASTSAHPLDVALQRLEGDKEVLAEIVSLFLADTPQLFEEAREALSLGDAASLAQAAHKLKGSVAYFDAGPAAAAASKLEVLGKSGDLRGGAALIGVLDEEIKYLMTALSSFTQRDADPGNGPPSILPRAGSGSEIPETSAEGLL